MSPAPSESTGLAGGLANAAKCESFSLSIAMAPSIPHGHTNFALETEKNYNFLLEMEKICFCVEKLVFGVLYIRWIIEVDFENFQFNQTDGEDSLLFTFELIFVNFFQNQTQNFLLLCYIESMELRKHVLFFHIFPQIMNSSLFTRPAH